MAEKRSVYRTQWAAQFAVASELCKRNYQVALTMGNHPEVDIMVISPNGVQFVIDVKGQYRKNWWLISPKKRRKNLFYILAFVPDDEPNQYFVLTQAEANREMKNYVKRAKAEKIKKGHGIEKVGLFPGLSWGVVRKFSNKWQKLPK